MLPSNKSTINNPENGMTPENIPMATSEPSTSSYDSISNLRRLTENVQRTRRAHLECRRRLALIAQETGLSLDSNEVEVLDESLESNRRDSLEGDRRLSLLEPETENSVDNEIDVVNGSPELFSSSYVDIVDVPDIPEWVIESMNQPVTETTNPTEEEIDVVNLPATEIGDTPLTVPQTITQSTPHGKNSERLIDILFDENAPLSTYLIRNESKDENLLSNDTNEDENQNNNISTTITPRRPKRRKTNTQSSNEDEIVDVVNLTEEAPPDFGSLSSALAESNRRTNSNLSDRITPLVDDTIIEISDSPAVPRIIPEIINIDDDDQEPYTPPVGNCPVCLEDLRKGEMMSTICGHVFCSTCIKAVMKTTKKCPKCRKHLTLKNIHPLFL